MRMLRVLHDLFYQPMADGGFFPLEELQNIFPSLDELIEVHCECRAAALLPAALLDPQVKHWGQPHPDPWSSNSRGTAHWLQGSGRHTCSPTPASSHQAL